MVPSSQPHYNQSVTQTQIQQPLPRSGIFLGVTHWERANSVFKGLGTHASAEYTRRRQGSHLHLQQSGLACTHTSNKSEMTRLTGGIGGKSRMLMALSAPSGSCFLATRSVSHLHSFSRHVLGPSPPLSSEPCHLPSFFFSFSSALWRDRTGGLNNHQGSFAEAPSAPPEKIHIFTTRQGTLG